MEDHLHSQRSAVPVLMTVEPDRMLIVKVLAFLSFLLSKLMFFNEKEI
jgi:hypothetical protein